MSDRAQEIVSVWREVDASGVKNGVNERRVLMEEPVVFLTGPGEGLEVAERSIQGPEVGLLGHLDELGVLDHHRLCDADGGFVRWKQGGTSGHHLALKHTWAQPH